MLILLQILFVLVFYILLLLPVLAVIAVLHSLVLSHFRLLWLKRGLVFLLLFFTITPLQLDSGHGAFFDMPIPRPIYSFYIDAITMGDFSALMQAVTQNPVFSVIGVLVSLAACGFLAHRAYPRR